MRDCAAGRAGHGGGTLRVARKDRVYSDEATVSPASSRPPGVWHFYSYWHEMKPDGVGHYWDNFFNAPQEPIEPGRWYCVEAMLKANSKPEASDGEQAFWVDGKRIGHFKGIRWRSSDKLKLNSFWLLDYVSDEVIKQSNEKYPDRVYEVWFDDIVVATDYIGRVQGKPKGGKKVAAPGKSALLTPGLLLPPTGKVVFSENFDQGPGAFRGGESRDGALAFSSKGVWVQDDQGIVKE